MHETQGNNSKGLWESLSPKQTFIVGLAGGTMLLCTIGFFILLGLILNGTTSFGTGDDVVAEGSNSGSDTETVVTGPKQFSQCLSSGKYAQKVKNDLQLGSQIGVNGTPATFINGYLMSGALPYEALKQVVDAVLEGQKPDFDFMKDESGELVKVDMPELPDVVWKGNENAKVTVVEFSDFECPYCSRYAPSIEQLVTEYGDKIRFTYRHFPLSFHPNAQKAAEAYECAKEQGKAFEMHDKLFEVSANGTLGTSAYNKAANELKLK